jgi:hypothetical protein
VSPATRPRPQSGARFGRPTTTASRRPRPRVNVRKRQPQPSGVGKLLQGLTRKPGASRGGGRRAGGRRAGAKGAGGAALLVSAAGLALKNREKLTSLLGRKKDTDTGAPPVGEASDAPEIRTAFPSAQQQDDAATSRPV